jgi:hypothetical protein
LRDHSGNPEIVARFKYPGYVTGFTLPAKNSMEIEDARAKAEECHLLLGRLLSKWQDIREAYDACLRLERQGALRVEDAARCNLCAELLEIECRFQPAKKYSQAPRRLKSRAATASRE